MMMMMMMMMSCVIMMMMIMMLMIMMIIINDNKYVLCFRILNKLSPEKFDKLSLELLNVGIETQVILKGVILLVSLVIY